MTMKASTPQNDADVHKGAVEGDRPDDFQSGNPHGDGVNDDGLPDDPVATAEDKLGANEDKTQG
jgi:hypothetical protein